MTSPTQRSLKLLRKHYPLVEVCEHWIPCTPKGFKGPLKRRDLFQFCDIIAISNYGTLAVQTTTAANVIARVNKIKTLPPAVYWLNSETRQLVVHGWKKVKNRWVCREIMLKLGKTGCPEIITDTIL